MDLAKYFKDSSKKRNLRSSEVSESGDDPKKLNFDEERSESTSSTLDDVFAEGLKNNECVLILANCLRNLEKQVKETFSEAKEIKESQIKGESSLNEVVKAIENINARFEEYEIERKQDKEKIEELNVKVTEMGKKIEELEQVTDRQEQYSRRNCLLLHGIEENDHENIDGLAIKFINEKMELDVKHIDIDRTHRIGRRDKTKKKVRPIIIKFSRYNIRAQVFGNKKKLKGSGKSITESLTKKRVGQLEEARSKYGFQNVWSYDGKILFKINNDIKTYYD